MSQKARIRKLMIGPSEKVTAKNSHVGMTVIADFVSDADSQRYLVFERTGATQAAHEAARRKVRKPVTVPETIPA